MSVASAFLPGSAASPLPILPASASFRCRIGALFLWGVLLQTGCSPGGGAISGQVTLKGTPPPEIKINLDPRSAKLWPRGLTTRHYLVSSNGGLANAFVCIRTGLSNHNFKPSGNPVGLEIRGGQFEPYVIGVFTNQPIGFRNADPVLENFNVSPRNSGNRGFNMAIPSSTPPKEPWYKKTYRFLFTRHQTTLVDSGRVMAVPEAFIRVKCDVHPWQFGYICVTDHPFFAVTDSDGNFKFPPNIPPGTYAIEARHLKAGAVTQEVVLGAGEKKRLEFTLSVPAAKASAR